MLYAYGATVVEIVRRKEFARFFYQRAQSILEVMAKLSYVALFRLTCLQSDPVTESALANESGVRCIAAN